ncbi:cell wall / vacuolar inhibitor of fructosidase 1-like [Coffea arabica]|uniref:Cell wall / vacuolar inhibitor of fructosidase 1-like n=1 Tax=Coffea arabica TaxID=13443 RepID=A0A6P6VM58_COFAR|nr:pectinesterase inhibitor-like [Coffea arabica]
MATIRVGLTLVLSIVTFLLLVLTSRGTAAEDFQTWCKKTTHNAKCIDVISADPRSDLKTSPSGFCTIVNDEAKAIAARTTSKISSLLRTTTDPLLKSALQECSEKYDSVNFRLDQDFSVLNHETYPTLAIALTEAYGQAQECEDLLNDPKPLEPSLTPEIQTASDIVETTLQILNFNECNKIDSCIG